jgi:hypothetical protein
MGSRTRTVAVDQVAALANVPAALAQEMLKFSHIPYERGPSGARVFPEDVAALLALLRHHAPSPAA